ncbi:MAG: nitronate monooxygenase [Dehalococcoidia bacterium]
MLRTRITELFDLRYPVISAPMAMHSGGTLAAAVSRAGGLGTFGGINPAGPDWVREQIRQIRSQTDRAFGMGFITAFIPVFAQHFELALSERVPVIIFSFGEPGAAVGLAKSAGAKVVCQVQAIELARQAVESGADALIVQGNEAGGHTGTEELLPLLFAAREQFPHMPIAAAGGISDGRTLAAALASGADGASMGTAFIATPEAIEVPDSYKQRIVESDGFDTVYTEVFDIVAGLPWPPGIAGRVYRNRFAQEWHGREDELRNHLEELAPAFAEAEQRHDTDIAAVYMGTGARAIDAIRPAADVLRSVCDEAERLLRDPLDRADQTLQ